MNRRELLSASLTAALSASLPAAVAAGADAPSNGGTTTARDVYELRRYQLKKGPMQQRADEYFKAALVPALRRLGMGPVGVFDLQKDKDPDLHAMYVLIPHPSAESVLTLPSRLAEDAQYQKAGEPFLAAGNGDVPFVTMDSILLQAFATMPHIDVPAGAAQNQPRIFELRTYRSPGERAGRKKIEMFETAGEIAIFRRVGLQPVFYGQDIIGTDLPSLTYMLTYPDMAAHDKAWKTFSGDPEWKKLKSTPGYTDKEIIASIINVFLTPTAYSQV